VKNDADISRSVDALTPFGKKYADELGAAPKDRDANTDPIGVALDKMRSLEQSLDARAVHDADIDKPVLSNDPPRKSAAQSELKIAARKPEGRTKDMAQGPEAETTGAGPAATITTIAPVARNAARALDVDDADDLTALLNRLDLDNSSRT
jgi:hypothetical protein